MTTELTLREKVLEAMERHPCSYAPELIASIADLLSATGAPAYCRVADDLRGAGREEEGSDKASVASKLDNASGSPSDHPARYLGQFDKRGGE